MASYIDLTQPPTPTSESPTNITTSLKEIQSSLEAIQKVWDENEMKNILPSTPREQCPPTPTQTASLKHTESWTSTDSSSFSSVLETPQTEEDEDEDEEDKVVAKIVANLQAKIIAVKKRKRLAREVENLRKELAAKEIELKECDRILALEMSQVIPS